MYHSLKKNWNLENDQLIRALLGPGFDSMSRIGFIHLFGIIKWLDFTHKWDFYNIFITKKHTFFTFGQKWSIEFPKILPKNATNYPEFSMEFLKLF